MLDAAPLASHLLGSAQHGSDFPGQHQHHHLGTQRDAEKELLLHRLSEMEHVLRQQQNDQMQAQQTITKLQAQIILLEERYRLTSDGQDQLGEDGLPQQGCGACRQQGPDAGADLGALSPPAALRSASLPGASAFAAAAAASSMHTSVLETSSSGGSSSTTAVGPASSSVPSAGGDSSASSAKTHGPWSQGAGFNAFGLNPAPSAPSHLAGAELPGGSLPMLQPSLALDALVPPLPTSLSGLSRSLSLSAAAGGTKQPQQQQQHRSRQPGASAGGALGVSDNNSSSEEFVQVRGLQVGSAAALECCSRVAAKVPCW